MAIGDPRAVAQWEASTSTRARTSQNSEMDVVDHFQQVIQILSALESDLKEKYEDSKGFYEDDGEDQSLGEMNAYKESQKLVGNLLYQVSKDLRSREAAMNNYSLTFQPSGHIGFP